MTISGQSVGGYVYTSGYGRCMFNLMNVWGQIMESLVVGKKFYYGDRGRQR